MKETIDKYLGKDANVTFEKIQVVCRIEDVRNSYGNIQLKVTPRIGSGSQWVTESRVRVI